MWSGNKNEYNCILGFFSNTNSFSCVVTIDIPRDLLLILLSATGLPEGQILATNVVATILITAPFSLKQRSLETLYLGSTSEPGRGYHWDSKQELSNSE